MDASAIAAGFGPLAPGQLRAALENFLPQAATSAEKISAIETGLRSAAGQSVRSTMARWIVDEIVPVSQLVPDAYKNWRPPVRDAMMFVVTRLSPARLAPKLLEQIELPPNTPAEVRLLRLIAKVPGLQKLGQVIARNQHLHPALRRALANLENGIRDVQPKDIREIIEKALGSRMQTFSVKVAPRILKEASVSAVVRFTWRNPETGRRERGVFKVLKPHIPEYFAEDMDYLQGLAEYFGDRHHAYGFAPHLIPDTFRKVRRLLHHEVNFTREQKTLTEAAALYRTFPGVRIPRVIPPLCTPTMTALTEEQGIKVTSAAARLPLPRRKKVAEQLVEALVAVPLFSSTEDAIFHGDPHAGNLLYNRKTGKLVILDWALRERLSREQRRHLALLFLMVTLRDPVGSFNEVLALSQHPVRATSPRGRAVREVVTGFLDAIPVSRMPTGADAMRLLERVAVQGIKFPSSLIMLSKVMFTLEGILGDIVGSDTGMGFTIARHVAQHWVANRSAFRSPLQTRDWLALQFSAMLYTSRVWVQWEQTILDRLLSSKSITTPPAITAIATRLS
ncbi:MAG TPA: AarF/UbiB family protein [Candidatus Sulfotelmatobacter sp.]|jgi:ubiquinone biosynthesis protein|nr:AarF/UbiB family protein [Candidatus Sulfotelmatobacter sp.]